MRIFLSGLGTVGQGVLEVISAKMPLLEKNYGGVKVVGVMDSKSYAISDDGLDMGSVLNKKISDKRCGDADRNGMSGPEILGKVDYDLLIECTPTNIDDGGEGLKNITSALENGKDVITVNKGPLALEFCKLMELAKKNGSIMRFEGSVGGAMPIINLCKEGLAGQEIRSINGIFNGTCNFILSRMDRGMPFDQALKEAQQLGYAEADPTYDIKGIDSACKVAILANAVFKKDVTIRDVTINGISGSDIEALKQYVNMRLSGENHDGEPENLTKLEIRSENGEFTVDASGEGKVEKILYDGSETVPTAPGTYPVTCVVRFGDETLEFQIGTFIVPEPPAEVAQPAPVYHVTDKDGNAVSYTAAREGGVLTIRVDAAYARLTLTADEAQALTAQGVEKVVFITTGATSAFRPADLTAYKDEAPFVLTHDGETVTFTAGKTDLASLLLQA